MEVKLDMSAWNNQIKAAANALEIKAKNAQAAAKSIVSTVIGKLLSETTRRTPIDEGALTASVEKRVEVKGQFASDVTGYVFVPVNSPAADYAVVMHEGTYNLGEKSLAKQQAQGVTVGPKYMERAFEENRAAFEAYILLRLKQELS